VNELLHQELRQTRKHASAGETSEAERHIRAALKIVYSAPVGTVSRHVRARVQEVAYSIGQNKMKLATAAIDRALQKLEEAEKPEDK
jgi:hypothetical protein